MVYTKMERPKELPNPTILYDHVLKSAIISSNVSIIDDEQRLHEIEVGASSSSA